jgi:hypothetical protein
VTCPSVVSTRTGLGLPDRRSTAIHRQVIEPFEWTAAEQTESVEGERAYEAQAEALGLALSVNRQQTHRIDAGGSATCPLRTRGHDLPMDSSAE